MSAPSASPLNKRLHGRCILIAVSVFAFLQSRKVMTFARFIVSMKNEAPPEEQQQNLVRIEATFHQKGAPGHHLKGIYEE